MIPVSTIYLLLMLLLKAVDITSQTVYTCDHNATCGCSRNPAIISRIVGGEAAANSTWGWAVSISIANRSLCGGSILSESWILSAAHCFDGYSAANIVIYAGSNLQFRGSQIRNPSRLIIHEKYNSFTFENDIALLQLSSPLVMNDPNINTICLPPDDIPVESEGVEWPPVNTSVVAIGWGRLYTNGPIPSSLQQVTVQIVDRRLEACSMLVTDWRVQLCAGIPGSGKDTCQGDSGGPLMLFDSDRRWILIGLTSTGSDCASPLFAGVYTRVRTFNQWIRSKIDGPPTTRASTTIPPPISSADRRLISGSQFFLAISINIVFLVSILMHG